MKKSTEEILKLRYLEYLDLDNTEIYNKDWCVITGRSIVSPHPYRRYTFDEFVKRVTDNNNSDFVKRFYRIYNDIESKEIELGNGHTALFLRYVGSGDPVPGLNQAVIDYVNNENYKEFIDMTMDNPWVRIVVKGENPHQMILE